MDRFVRSTNNKCLKSVVAVSEAIVAQRMAPEMISIVKRNNCGKASACNLENDRN